MIALVLLVSSLCLFALSKLTIWRVFSKRNLSQQQYKLMLFSAWIILLLTIVITILDKGSYGLLTLIGYSAPVLLVIVCAINSVKRIKNKR